MKAGVLSTSTPDLYGYLYSDVEVALIDILYIIVYNDSK